MDNRLSYSERGDAEKFTLFSGLSLCAANTVDKQNREAKNGRRRRGEMNGNYDLMDLQYGGRKGKTCSMSGCTNTHQRCPSLSFFRFPKELNR